jgi:hypothetical protein
MFYKKKFLRIEKQLEHQSDVINYLRKELWILQNPTKFKVGMSVKYRLTVKVDSEFSNGIILEENIVPTRNTFIRKYEITDKGVAQIYECQIESISDKK